MKLIQKNFLYFLILRWVTLAHVAILYLLGMDIGSKQVFLMLICYTAVLTILQGQVSNAIKKYPILLYLDLTAAFAAICLTGGSWKSPYYLYVFSSLMVLPLFMGLKSTLLATSVFSVLYTFGLVFYNQTVLQQAIRFDADSFIANYVAFFSIAIFFGYPACIIREIEKTVKETTNIKAKLDRTGALIGAINSAPLSDRELEVIRLLSEGRTNMQIAEELYISEKTVRNHLSSIYKKLGVSSRAEAVFYYHANTSLMDT